MPTLGELAQFFFATKADAESRRGTSQGQALNFATNLRGAAAQGAEDRATGASARAALGPAGAELGDLDAAATLRALRAEEELGLNRTQAGATLDATRALSEQRRRGMDPAELEKLKAQLRAEGQGTKDEAAMERLLASIDARLEAARIGAGRPQISIVQSPEGPLRVDRRTGLGSPITTTEGGRVPPMPTTDERNRRSGMGRAMSVFNAIRELSKEINTVGGPAALVSGTVRQGAEKANLDPVLSEYNSVIYGFTPMFARAAGHTGVLTQQDVDSVRMLFPTPRDSDEVAEAKLSRVESIMAGMTPFQFPSQQGGAAAPGASAPGAVGAQDFPEVDQAGFARLPVGEMFSRNGKVYRKVSASEAEEQ